MLACLTGGRRRAIFSCMHITFPNWVSRLQWACDALSLSMYPIILVRDFIFDFTILRLSVLSTKQLSQDADLPAIFELTY